MANMMEIGCLNALAVLEEAEMAVERPPRKFLPQQDPFEILNDRIFLKLFRLSKIMVRDLIEIIQDFLIAPSRVSALSKELKVLLALKFYTSGSYQTDIGYTFFLGVSQSSTCRAIDEVTNTLNQPQILNEWVKFPNTIQQLEAIRRREYGIPGIVGSIDCTHVSIVPPNRPDYEEHVYVNLKNYHSINVQLVCNTNLNILNVNARFPGSTRDAFIWSQSNIANAMMQLNRTLPDFFLIGDSGYPLRAWLQTPIRNPAARTPEERYNNDFVRARGIIERCNGPKNAFSLPPKTSHTTL